MLESVGLELDAESEFEQDEKLELELESESLPESVPQLDTQTSRPIKSGRMSHTICCVSSQVCSIQL